MRRLSAILFCALFATNSYAQNDDFGIWTTIGIEKKITNKITLSPDVELRTRNNAKTVDRWSGTLNLSYSINTYIKIGGYYSYLHSQKESHIKKTGEVVPDYWYPRHKFNFYVSGKYKIDRLSFAIREMWQYTYRPEKSVRRYKSDGITIDDTDELLLGRGENLLRSRLTIEYDVTKNLFTPYASVELYNGKDGINKSRYTVGASSKLSKHNRVGVYYRYQVRDDKSKPKEHILGFEYKYLF